MNSLGGFVIYSSCLFWRAFSTPVLQDGATTRAVRVWLETAILMALQENMGNTLRVSNIGGVTKVVSHNLWANATAPCTRVFGFKTQKWINNTVKFHLPLRVWIIFSQTRIFCVLPAPTGELFGIICLGDSSVKNSRAKWSEINLTDIYLSHIKRILPAPLPLTALSLFSTPAPPTDSVVLST